MRYCRSLTEIAKKDGHFLSLEHGTSTKLHIEENSICRTSCYEITVKEISFIWRFFPSAEMSVPYNFLA